MTFRFAYLPFLFLSVSSLAQTPKEKVYTHQFNAIDSTLNQVLKDQYVAGFAVAIVKGNGVIYSKGFGYRDVAQKKPVTPNTLFAIGSSTKAFTSSLIGLLEKEDKLKLDDKAVSHLPQLRFISEEMNNQVTIRDLMSHRTGLSRYDYAWFLFNTRNRDSLIQKVRYMQPTAPVRQKWLYNNFMFLAQGMIAEKITGKTWEQQIKEKFFDPLEMKRSNTDIQAFKLDADASLPYTVIKDTVIKKIDYYNINGMGPAGSINSSANDMANWLKVWISGGQYKGKEILPTSYVAAAASSQMVIDGSLPSQYSDIYFSNYGLGWMLSSYRGHYMVEHGGNINGFSASVSFFPADQLGIVVLTNQNGSAVPDVVRSSIADRLLDLKAIDWNGDAKKRMKAAKIKEKQDANANKPKTVPNTKPAHPMKDYVGDFENPAYGMVRITLKNDQLYTRIGEENLVLKHVHYDVFDPRSIDEVGAIDTAESNIRFNFVGNQDGKIQSLIIPLDEGKPVTFEFKPVVPIIPLKELEQYVGEYQLGAITTKVYLKGKTLFVFVPGQPEYETEPKGDATFVLKALKGFSVKFEAVGDAKAGAVMFIQPNGSFKAIRKK